jgi:methyl-accepting chemotaxis protein
MSETHSDVPARTESHPRRRRRLFSRPADQFRTTLVPTLGAAVLLVVLVSAVHQIATAKTRELVALNPDSADLLAAQSGFLESTVASAAILYLFGVLAVGLIHSRRLMGALFAMNRRIRRLAQGDLASTLRLRRNDYFHDVADGINDAAGVFKRQAEEDLADVNDIISLLDRSPQAVTLQERVRESLTVLRDRKRRLLGMPAMVEPSLRELVRR